MNPLSQSRPRPRTNARKPRYPAMLGVGVLLAATGCAGVAPSASRLPQASTGSEEDPARVLVVPSVKPAALPAAAVENDPAPPPPPLDLLAGVAPPKFPEDNLNSIMSVGCGGGCPPAYVLETRYRDSGQVKARIRYCAKAARGHLPTLAGRLTAQAHIDAGGQARRVVIEATGTIPPPVASCVQRLIETAVFSSKYNFERDSQEYFDIKAVEDDASSPQ